MSKLKVGQVIRIVYYSHKGELGIITEISEYKDETMWITQFLNRSKLMWTKRYSLEEVSQEESDNFKVQML